MFPAKSEEIKQKFFARGKVLLTGEYLVIRGARSLALPTRLGQHLEISEGSGSEVVWKSLDRTGKEWFSAHFDLMGFDCIKSSDQGIAERLRSYLRAASRDNSDFLSKWKKYRVTSKMEFDRNWGLGSSSTLIHLIAQWAEANPFLMYFDTEEGSGYDIACAGSDGPILFELGEESLHYESCDFAPSFMDKLYFIHLGNKQDTRKALEDFGKKKISKTDIQRVSEITEAMCSVKSLSAFIGLMGEHDEIVSNALGKERIIERFSGFDGYVKSLGAWGGDMALVASKESEDDLRSYFLSQGIDQIFRYETFVV